MVERQWLGGVILALCAGGLLVACGSAGERTTTSATRPIRHAAATPRSGFTTTTQTRPRARSRPATRPAPDAARLLGQMIVARFQGTAPSASFLARVRSGQIGGVILFADNVAGGVEATRAIVEQLQQAARAGRNPPLLIMTDQEGGEVKRFLGPPELPAADMTSPGVALAQGRATGRLLRAAGVNVDLAPVADVLRIPGSFLGTRSFGSTPLAVARRACAFAKGVSSARVAYTLKHFPGLGRAPGNTDLRSVSVDATPGALRSDYRGYEMCGANPRALVMVSSAVYPTLSGGLPAVMSPAIYRHELSLAIPGRSPLTISDDLQSPAIESQTAPARRAIDAGLDLLLYAQTEQASDYAYSRLLSDVRAGLIPVARLVAAERKILALKNRLR